MAFTKKAVNDHFLASFGQEDELVPTTTDKDGLIVGGVYQSAPALDSGDYSRLQVDSAGNLKSHSEIQSTYGTATIASAGEVGTAKIEVNGLLKQIVYVTPDTEDDDSSELSIVDEKGHTLYTAATVAESGTFVLGTSLTNPYDLPLVGTTSLVFTAEGTQGAAIDYIYYVKTR